MKKARILLFFVAVFGINLGIMAQNEMDIEHLMDKLIE